MNIDSIGDTRDWVSIRHAKLFFKYMFYAQKENSERKQKNHKEYKNCRTLPSVFLLCDCQKKILENSGTQLRTSRKGRYATGYPS